MGAVNRQMLRSERSTEALLDAAAELIAEVGLAAMTFAAIGERAGYSRGMVRFRFGSKAGLVDALIHRVLTNLREARPTPAAGDGLAQMIGLIEAIRDLTLAESRDMRALLALMFEALGADPELRSRMAEFQQTMRADIAAALRDGLVDGSVRDGVDPTDSAVIVVSVLRGIAYQWLLEPDSVDLVRAYDGIIELLRARFAASCRC